MSLDWRLGCVFDSGFVAARSDADLRMDVQRADTEVRAPAALGLDPANADLRTDVQRSGHRGPPPRRPVSGSCRRGSSDVPPADGSREDSPSRSGHAGKAGPVRRNGFPSVGAGRLCSWFTPLSNPPQHPGPVAPGHQPYGRGRAADAMCGCDLVEVFCGNTTSPSSDSDFKLLGAR